MNPLFQVPKKSPETPSSSLSASPASAASSVPPSLSDTLAFRQIDTLAPDELAQLAGTLLLRSSGEDVEREGLQKTPQRFAKAMKHLLSGYRMTPEQAVGGGVFEAEGSGLVTVQNIEFYSLCEHHTLPFWGHASVAYYPNTKILGLSKIPRLVNLFGRRFQVQERLTRQVAEAIQELIQPRAVAVKIRAAHLCMMMRGVEKQQSQTATEFVIGLDRLESWEKERLWASLSP
jgi:GTP cyclohydrolase I